MPAQIQYSNCIIHSTRFYAANQAHDSGFLLSSPISCRFWFLVQGSCNPAVAPVHQSEWTFKKGEVIEKHNDFEIGGQKEILMSQVPQNTLTNHVWPIWYRQIECIDLFGGISVYLKSKNRYVVFLMYRSWSPQFFEKYWSSCDFQLSTNMFTRPKQVPNSNAKLNQGPTQVLIPLFAFQGQSLKQNSLGKS